MGGGSESRADSGRSNGNIRARRLTGYIVHRAKREKMLVELPQVTLEGTPLKYKMQVEYLGHMFQGDGGSAEATWM